MFNNILKAELAKIKEQTAFLAEKINTIEGSLSWNLKGLATPYKRKKIEQNLYPIDEIKTYLHKRLKNKEGILIQKMQENLEALEKSYKTELLIPITITVEWKKSKQWGLNPTATSNHNVTSGSISGSGYDKESTAIAYVLNQYPTIISRLANLKNSNMKGKNRELLGYGSGYGIIPEFEGGVGVNCFHRILEKINLTLKIIGQTKNVTIYQVN